MSGNGALTIAAGAMLVSNGGIATELGRNPGSTGVVTVTGQGSTWNNNRNLIVGLNGVGTLNVENAGSVFSASGYIGMGSATVTGAGSRWTISGDLTVTQAGPTLRVHNGGSVSSRNGLIGTLAGAVGSATVSGAGSIWAMTQKLSIGGDLPAGTNGGNGTLSIDAGGSVSVAQDATLFSLGQLRLQGGTFSTSAVNFQGAGGQFLWTSGTLHVGIYNGNLTNPSGGILAPGSSVGSTLVVGEYTQEPGATLDIELGGTLVNSEYDFVNVTGTAWLGGQLNLTLINGFVPTSAQTFTIFQAASLLNDFSNVADGQRLTTIDGTGSFLIHYGPTSIFNQNQIWLTDFQLARIPGDYNHNGVVDGADYVVWRKGLGTTYAQNDYNAWRTKFGQPSASGAAAGSPHNSYAVPESANLGLLLVEVLILFTCQRISRIRPSKLIAA